MDNLTVRLQPGSGTPLYMQLYRHISEEIACGRITGSERLPSKRRLSQNLGVSLNTVDTAYQMLVAEGYVTARAKSGYYAANIERPEIKDRPSIPAAPPKEPPAEKLTNLSTGLIDPTFFPYKTWGRIQRDVLANHPEYLNHGAREGDIELREAIARYLHEYRAVLCSPGQIIVGAGMEYLMGLLSGLFFDRVFALENPCYARVANILKNNRVRYMFLPVDQDGLSVSTLKKSAADIVYVTPSHQFPTGAIMPVKRRTELLSWACEKEDRLIIEDDYDSEFRFDTKPLPSLQGIDSMGRVIYIGTFSRSLAPSIRIAYMVLPERILPFFRECYAFYSSTVSRFEQHTLRRFIDEGHFARYLNRMRVGYRARRDMLVRELQAAFGRDRLTILGAHTGLHFILQVHNGMSETLLVQKAKQSGIRVAGLSGYMFAGAPAPVPSLVLGYSALNEQNIPATVESLKKAWFGETSGSSSASKRTESSIGGI